MKKTLTAIALIASLAVAGAAHADALNDYLTKGIVPAPTAAPAHRCPSAETLALMGATEADLAVFRYAGCKIAKDYRPAHESDCTYGDGHMHCEGN